MAQGQHTLVVPWDDAAVSLRPGVTLLRGADGSKYPSGTALLLQGTNETLIIDPTIDVIARGGAPAPVDTVVNSHAHEDHVAGNGLFGDARVYIHEDDLPGITSLDGFMAIYGLTEPTAEADWRREVVEQFHFTPRPDAQGFSDGHCFELGNLQVEAMHLPGHTRGHCGFRINDVFYLGDIDLSGFGPYYGDHWSSLEQFDESLRKVRAVDAHFYVTFHHKGVFEGRENFLAALDKFTSVIDRRHTEMLAFLAQPRSLEELVRHRFIYRPHVENTFVTSVEHRSATLHLERMLARGEAVQLDDGRFLAG